MGYKKYIGLSIVLIIAIGGYVFSIAPGKYAIAIKDITITLPIAVWVTLPLAVLFLASLFHMFYYGFKNYLKNKAIEKDEEALFDYLQSMVLGKEVPNNFKTKEFKELADILSQFKLDVKNSNFSSNREDLNKAVTKVLDIKSGKYLSSKDLKLDDANELMQLNIANKVENDSDFCLEVIKKADSYSEDLVKRAFVNVITNKSMTTVKKCLPTMPLDKDTIQALFKRDSEEKDFNLSDEEILKYIKDVEFGRVDFINMARAYKNEMQPDRLINIFEELSNNNELALEAYVYVLFEYEMIDKIRDILVNSNEHELIPYKALLDLKDAGKHYTLDSLCINS